MDNRSDISGAGCRFQAMRASNPQSPMIGLISILGLFPYTNTTEHSDGSRRKGKSTENFDERNSRPSPSPTAARQASTDLGAKNVDCDPRSSGRDGARPRLNQILYIVVVPSSVPIRHSSCGSFSPNLILFAVSPSSTPSTQKVESPEDLATKANKRLIDVSFC